MAEVFYFLSSILILYLLFFTIITYIKNYLNIDILIISILL